MPGLPTAPANLLGFCLGPVGAEGSTCVESQEVKGDIRGKGPGEKLWGGNGVWGADFGGPAPRLWGAGTGRGVREESEENKRGLA